MFIKKEIANFEDLADMCWAGACDVLRQAKKVGREEELFEIVEEYMNDPENLPTETELNDFIRYDINEIMHLW